MHTDTMVTTVVGQALDPGHRLGPENILDREKYDNVASAIRQKT